MNQCGWKCKLLGYFWCKFSISKCNICDMVTGVHYQNWGLLHIRMPGISQQLSVKVHNI